MPDQQTLRLILNGKSAALPTIRSAVQTLRSQGHRLEVRVTWESGDAARYAAEAIHDGVEVIIAGGGDGSVNEVVGGMLETGKATEARLAILPLGTANDFATSCGIPIGDPLAALQLAAEGRDHAIDIGKINENYFINVASGGFGAEVTTNTPPELKKAIGGAAYALVGIATAAKMTPHRCTLTLPDGTRHQGDLFVLGIGNGRQCGGGQQLAPRARLNDGKLDLLAVHDLALGTFGTFINEWVTLGDVSNQHVSYAQLESFVIESDAPMQVNLDGEPLLSGRFECTTVREALRLICPDDNPMLQPQ